MGYYEMLYILSPDFTDEERDSQILKFKEFVEKNKGVIKNEVRWGLRNLTYPIKKKDKGYYVLTYLEIPESFVKEIKYFIRVNEGFLRAMILKKKEPEEFEEEKKEESENV